MEKSRVCIVGGPGAVRDQLAIVLKLANYDVAGKFDYGAACWQLTAPDPDLLMVLVDTARPDKASTAISQLHERYPACGLVAVATVANKVLLQACVDAGATSFLPLTMPANAYCQALRVSFLGENVYVGGDRPIWRQRKAAVPTWSGDRPVERRSSPRRRTLMKAKLVFADGNCVMDCAIFDISETGAKIKPADHATLPSRFELRIKFGSNHMCEVVRRKANFLGVRFLAEDSRFVATQPSWQRFGHAVIATN